MDFKALGYDIILEKLAAHTASATGHEAALKSVPATSADKVELLTSQTLEAQSVVLRRDYPMSSFSPLSEELARLRSGAMLSALELLRVNTVFHAVKKAKRGIENSTPLLFSMVGLLETDDHVSSAIERCIVNEDEISDNASPALRDIRRKMRMEQASVREKLNSIIRSKEYSKYLQDAILTERNGRFVVPVKAEHRSMVSGLVHAESGSGATLFIEPMAVVEANNRLKALTHEEAREIERILCELSELVRPFSRALATDIDILTKLDVIFARFELAHSQNAVPVTLSTDGRIRIVDGRHPQIDPKTVIPISLDFSDNCLVITGPNTGGKTVTLKMIGLFALMAQSGMFVPARVASLPIFSDVRADIGDDQSIEQSLSTFSSHIKNIISIIDGAKADCLILIDELGAGTDPDEGASLALAILRHFNALGAKLIITTHFAEIKAFALNNVGYMNACMEFDPNSLKPTYKLLMGIPGASNAFHVASALGMKPEIISDANSFMDSERVHFDELILGAERTRREAEESMAHAEVLKSEAQKIEAKAKVIEADVADRRQQLLEKARQEAAEIVAKAKVDMDEVIAELKTLKHSTDAHRTKTIERARKSASEAKTRYAKPVPTPKVPVKADELALGQSVLVCSIDAKGTITSLPDRGMVGVRAGIMNLTVPLYDIELTNAKIESQKAAGRAKLERKSISLSMNVHGYTVEEAMVEVDKYLDDAFLSGLEEVSIVHGKGTGALRAGIHRFLKTHPHVKTFRLGRFGEGEDGVTVVTLKK